MEHSRRVVFHFSLFKVKVFGLVVSDADREVAIVVDIVAWRAALRRPVMNSNTFICTYHNTYKPGEVQKSPYPES